MSKTNIEKRIKKIIISVTKPYIKEFKRKKSMYSNIKELSISNAIKEILDITEKEISKALKQQREEERKELKKNIGALRQYLNERMSEKLITNDEIETFINLK